MTRSDYHSRIVPFVARMSDEDEITPDLIEVATLVALDMDASTPEESQ